MENSKTRDSGHAPEISIIVPVYKVERFLQQCIDSILNQTFRDFELILVDDGSPDRCPELCDEAARRDERIRVIHQQNGGLSAARNAGLDAARGEWIGFVDSDDEIDPQMYEKLYHAVKEHGANLAICRIVRIDEESRLIEPPYQHPQEVELSRQQAIGMIARSYMHIACTKLYHRDIFAQIRFPVGRLNEDSFVAPAVLEQVTTAVCLHQPFYRYRQRAESIMTAKRSLRNYDAVEAAYACWQCQLRNGCRDTLPEGAMFVLGSLRNVYCGLSRADRHAPRSREMKKLQRTVTAKTLRMGRFSAPLLLQTIVFQLCPMGYHYLAERKKRGS